MPTIFTWTTEEATPASITRPPIGSVAELPRDLQLDSSGDLLIESNDLVLSSGRTAIEQDLASRLRIIRGEWFLDLDRGLPYFEDLFRKGPNLNAFRAEVRETIEATPGVVELIDLTLTEDRATRSLVIDFRARTDAGELVADSLPLLEI